MQTIVNSLFDYIIDNGIATDSEVGLVVDINGCSEETMNDIIFFHVQGIITTSSV